MLLFLLSQLIIALHFPDFGLVAFTRNKAASKSRDPSVHGRRKSTLEVRGFH